MSDTRWHYDTAGDLNQTLAQRLRTFPRQPDMLVYATRSLAALALRGWLRVYHRLRIEGREHLPATGSFILVCNHASHLDALCLLSALPLRKLHRAFPAAAEEYFFVNFPRTALAAVFVNAMPFSRSLHMRHSLGLCRALLGNAGNVLILFPEGTRSLTGSVGKFRPGIGCLAAGLDVPVVPCALRGGFEAWPKGSRFPRPRSLRLIIGAPRSYADITDQRDAAHHIAAELQTAVQELLCKRPNT